MPAGPVTVGGDTFPTLAAAALAHGLKPGTVSARLHIGWTLEEALGLGGRVGDRKRPITVAGESYPSLTEAAAAHQIATSLVSSRLSWGWSVDEAFGLTRSPLAPQRAVVVEGVEYPTMAAAARKYGVDPRGAAEKVRAGKTVAQALGLEANPRANAKPVCVNGVTYASFSAAAAAHGVDVSTAKRRMQLGLPLEKVFDCARQPAANSNPVTVAGKAFTSVSAAARAHGKDARYVNWALKDGGRTIEEALGLAPAINRQSQALEVRGVHYSSLEAAAVAHSIKPETFNKRLRKYGWTVEEALELVERPVEWKRVGRGLVYLVTHIESGKSYVGATQSTLAKRWAEHIETARSRKTVSPHSLAAAIRTFGENAFKREVLASAENLAELARKETQHIAKHGTMHPGGFNLNRGGLGLHGRGKAVTVNGKRYPTMAEAARAHGLTVSALYGRLGAGMSMDEALAKPLTPRPTDVEFEGKRYETIQAMCDAHGVPLNAFHYRRSKGLSLEQCLAPYERQKPGPKKGSPQRRSSRLRSAATQQQSAST